MGSKLRMESGGADRRSILISTSVRNKGFVCNVQSEFAFHTSFPNAKCILTRLWLRLESDVLNNRSVAHLAP